MSVMSVSTTKVSSAAFAALIVAAAGIATILGAYYFQFVLGYLPCPLCYDERIPYYTAIPIALVTAILAARSGPRGIVTAGLVILALIMFASMVLGAYHAGVEWKWWPGPADCTGALGGVKSTADLLRRMQSEIVVRCDDAAWRLFGISLAGYNAMISLVLVAISAWGARHAAASRP
jgi:disulfide bond formation protein DsbB